MNEIIKNGWKIGYRPEVIETGRNPESADASNPTGAWFDTVCFALAEDERGRRYVGPEIGRENVGDDLLEEKTSELAETLSDDFNPEEKGWFAVYPCYGSKAYEDGEAEQARADAEDDHFCAPFVGY